MSKTFSSLPSVFQRHFLPAVATFASVIGAAIVYLAITPNTYETTSRLILDEKQVSISELGRDLTQSGSSGAGSPNSIANQAELVKSERVIQQALANVPNSQPPITPGNLSQGLKVKIVPATNILELHYSDRDPNRAAKILNAVSVAMVAESAAVIRREAASARQFLAEEVPKQAALLQAAEVVENNYRRNSGVVSLADQTKSLVDSLASIEDQERNLTASLQEASARDGSLQKITSAGNLKRAYASVRGGQDEELKKLRAKLAELNAKVAESRLKYTDQHPILRDLVQQRNYIQSSYNQALAQVSPANQAIAPSGVAGDDLSQKLTSQLVTNSVERSAIANKLKTVQAERTYLQARLTQLPIQQQPLTALTRRREEAASSLKLLQSKLEEARIAEAQLVGNIRLIDLAKPPTAPTSPKRSAVLVVATVFGSILALGVVVLLEMMDNTLRDGSEAEELLQLPLLGVLPTFRGKSILALSDDFLDNVGLVEPYRMLLKTLEFRSEELRVIVISSTFSGEGKSIVASHLAAVSAILSRRTLLVDADLRRPVQHKLFNLDRQPGITDAIAGRESLLHAAQPTSIENLSVLTCGEMQGHPSQFLESGAIKSLLLEAANHYDLVVIDTSPISASADAATISKYSDGLMLVTRPSVTVKEVMQRAVSELTRNHIPILGVIVNGMTNNTEKYYRYPLKGYEPVLPTRQPLVIGALRQNYSRGGVVENDH